jgi:type II secretory pathway pseudopilin PulG
MSADSRLSEKARGFTLAELAVVLLIVGFLMFLLLPASNVMLSNSRHSATQQKLANIDAALVNFVMVNKRLPCPANGSAIGTAAAGVEGSRDGNGDCTAFAGAAGIQDRGVVPYVALGLTLNDVVDAWNNQITYRVGWGLTRTSALDMSACDPAGTATNSHGNASNANTSTCAAGCTGSFIASCYTQPVEVVMFRGLNVKSDLNTTIMDFATAPYTGAAYVLISHGDNGYGAYSASGIYQSPGSGWPATPNGTTLEDANWNSGAGHAVTSGAPPAFIDAPLSDSGNVTTYFDDIVVRPSLVSVVSRAQLSPRGH